MRSKIGCYTLFMVIFVGSCTAIENHLFNDRHSYTSKSRNPSSIHRVYDYSDLNGRSLQSAIKDRFMESTEIKYTGNYVIIQTGHFAMLDQLTKEKVFACEYFDTITYEFEASNVFVDGDNSPFLSVQTECQIGSNINYMVPLKLPLALIKAEKPGTIEKKLFEQSQSMTVKTEHIPTEWPHTWVLKSIKLNNSKLIGRTLVVPVFEMGMSTKQQLTMRW